MNEHVDISPTVAAVVAVAAAAGLRVEPVEFPDGTRTAADAAAAIGCTEAQIVKSLVFVVEGAVVDGAVVEGAVIDGPEFEGAAVEGAVVDGPSGDEVVLALLAGDDRLDPARLAAAAGGSSTRRATADEVRAATGVAIGGVAPFGLAGPLRCFVDPGVLAHTEVWAAAGTPRHVFAAEPQALVAAVGAEVAALAI